MPYFGTPSKTFGFEATVKDTFSGDDSTVAFTLSQTSATNDVEVFVGNVQQEPTIAYSISGTTLTFTEAPPTGTNNIYVLHRSRTRDTILPPADLGDKNYAMSGALSVTGNITTTGNLKINDGANIGSTSDTDAISISSTGDVTLTQNLKVKDGGTIGSASDTDAISISSTGVTTFSQRDIHSGGITIADGGEIGSASDANAITIASGGGVTFAEVANVDKGIKFPGTQVSSTNANTLDDYEEGTYTPVVTINASSTGIALSNALGFYNKIGRQCIISNRITLTNKGSSTGTFAVSLPFTASSNGIQGGALLHYGVNFSTLSANAIYAVAVADAATYNLATSSGGQLIGSGGGQSDQIANNTDFIVTFTYLTT